MSNQSDSLRKLLILGSSGQIGSALVAFFQELNFDVLEYDIALNLDQDLRKWPNPSLEDLIRNSDYVFF